MESDSSYSFVSSFFHSTCCFVDSSTFFKVPGKCFPLHCLVFHCVNIQPLLTILLLWIFGCLQFLVIISKGTMCFFLKGLYLEVEMWTMLSSSIIYVEIHQKFPVFQSGYIIIHSYEQYMTLPIALHACQHLILSVFLILAIVLDIQWWLFSNEVTHQTCTTKITTTAIIYHHTQHGNLSTFNLSNLLFSCV